MQTMTMNCIEVTPRVMMGKPVIRGTRIPVELLLRKISEGATEDYPRLQREDIPFTTAVDSLSRMVADGAPNPSRRRSAVPLACGWISWTGWNVSTSRMSACRWW